MKNVKNKPDSFLVIVPEVIYTKGDFLLTYTIYSKYSKKQADTIYIIHHVLRSNVKIANLHHLYDANDQAISALVKHHTEVKGESSKAKFYMIYEVKGNLKFVPDHNIYSNAIQFIQQIKENKLVDFIGLIFAVENITRMQDVSDTAEKFFMQPMEGFYVDICNNFKEAKEKLEIL